MSQGRYFWLKRPAGRATNIEHNRTQCMLQVDSVATNQTGAQRYCRPLRLLDVENRTKSRLAEQMSTCQVSFLIQWRHTPILDECEIPSKHHCTEHAVQY
jgi:hypothetical protein